MGFRERRGEEGREGRARDRGGKLITAAPLINGDALLSFALVVRRSPRVRVLQVQGFQGFQTNLVQSDGIRFHLRLDWPVFYFVFKFLL